MRSLCQTSEWSGPVLSLRGQHQQDTSTRLGLLTQDTSLRVASPRSLDYYFANLERLFDPRYEPLDADILHCRNKTTGIIETIFPIADRMYR